MNERVFMLRGILVAGFVLFGFAVAEAQPRVYRDRVEPQWFSLDQKFWYRADLKDGGREFVVVDAMAGTRLEALKTEGGTQLVLPAGPSENSTDETEIVVSNNLAITVSLFWVDADLNQRGYGTSNRERSIDNIHLRGMSGCSNMRMVTRSAAFAPSRAG